MIEEAEVCYKTVSSEYVRVIALLNSQQLWPPTQALHNIRPVSILAKERESLGASPLAEDLLAADGYGRKAHFLQECG